PAALPVFRSFSLPYIYTTNNKKALNKTSPTYINDIFLFN
ncbi:hypothetical protein HMPREF1609_00233, partial [Escherichia coli 908541]